MAKKNFDWDKLKIFHKVIEHKSISSAARELGVKQSSVSRQIHALEISLGAPLMRRHARGIDLTEQGEILYNISQEFSERLLRTQSLITESKTEPQGLIRIATKTGFGSLWLVQQLNELLDEHPNLRFQVQLTEQDLDGYIQDVDCIIRFGPSNRLDLIQRLLFKANYSICATREYLDKYGTPEILDDLSRHRLIAYTDLILTLGCQTDQKREPVLKVNTVQAILNGILGNMGIGILPNYIFYEEPRLVRILPDQYVAALDCYFCYPQELKNSKKISVFRDFLVKKTSGID